MPRTPVAVTLVAVGLAFTAAQADEMPDNRVETSLRSVADGSHAVPDGKTMSGKANDHWLHALAGKFNSARSALKGHKLVVTSEGAETRTFDYEDVAKSVGAAEAQLADVAAGDSLARRIDLSLPQRANRDGELKVEVTGGVDTVGVLLSKKM
jgi:hypothetical protein